MEYVILLCLVLILWYISGVSVQSLEKKYAGCPVYERVDSNNIRIFGYRVNKNCFVTAVALMILLVGLRSISVGWDTVEYKSLFDKISNINSIRGVFDYKIAGNTTQEWGFIFYTWICGRYLNFQLYLLIAAAIYIIPVAIYIYRYSDDVFLSLFLFLTYGMYTFSFSTMRQCMAMGFCMLAILLGEEAGKIWKYFLLMFVAIMMHRTAVIFLPAFLYKKIRVNKASVISIAIVAFLFYRFRNSILLFLLGYARNTGAFIETGGTLQYLFVIGIIILGVINLRKFIINNPERNRNQFLFVCMCVVAVIFPVLKQNPTYFRLYYFNYMFMVVYIPNVLSSYKSVQIRRCIKVSIFLLGLYMLYKQVVLTTNPLLPYYFFWQN